MDTEYILRIILKARDEIAGVLARARAEIRGFSRDAQSMKAEIDKINTSISGMNRRLGGLTDRLEKWRQTIRGARSATDELADSETREAKATERLATAKEKLRDVSNRVGGSQRAYNSALEALGRAEKASRQEAEKLVEAREKNLKSLRNLQLEHRKRVQSLQEEIRLEQNLRTRVHDKGTDLSQLRTQIRGESDLLGVINDKIQSIDRSSVSHRRAATSLDSYSRSTRRVERDNDSLSKSILRTDGNIASLDNRLRGIALLLVFAFAQQLITVLGGLGGELLAVAGSAAMAGAAIGGGLVAGIAQAVPAAALLTGAIIRLKQVFDAVDAAQKLQQAQFVSGAQASKQAADRADTLSAAQRRLKDAQETLNKARENAKDDLNALVLAEKNAELAARGAALSQAEAQEQLRLAVQGGDVSEIREAELQVIDRQIKSEEALKNARKASRDATVAKPGGGGAENLESVKNARRAVEDAAESLEKANRAADAASGSINTAAQNLAFLLSQLSPAERALYDSVTRIRENYKRLWRPITDIIIDSFTTGLDRVNVLMQNPAVLNTARRMSTAIGTAIDELSKVFTSDTIVAQLNRIADAGTKNIPKLTELAETVGRIFLNIAEDAGPALSRFIDFVNELATEFLETTEKGDGLVDFFIEGEKHIESWINLFISLIKLFAALTGAGGGAESGREGIEELTSAIDNLTEDVKRNADGVREFFDNAREVVRQVVRVIVALASELFAAFDPKIAKNFADVLIAVWIPALGMVIRTIGELVDKLNKLFSIPVVADLARYGLAFLIFAQVAQSTVGAFIYIYTVVSHLMGIFGLLGRSLLPLIARFGGLNKLIVLTGRLVPLLLGPWGLLIGAVILIIAKLGLLDDVVRAVLGFFQSILDETREPLENLITALGRLWDTLSGGASFTKVLTDVLSLVIQIGAAILSSFGTIVGQSIARAINLLTRLANVLTKILRGDVVGAAKEAANAIGDLFKNEFRSPAAQKARDIANAIKESTKKIQTAEEELARSQRDSAQAQRDLTDARRAASRELSDLRAGSEQGQLDIRQARISLQDAERDRRALGRGASKRDIEEADLRVDQARKSLRDTTRNAARAEEDYTTAKKRGVKGDEDVVKAQTEKDKADKRKRDNTLTLTKERNAARTRLKEARDQGFDIGRAIRQGILLGFLPTALISSVNGIFSRVIGAVKNFLGIESPSTVFKEIGRAMVDGLLSAFTGIGAAILKKLAGVPGKILGWVGEKFGQAAGAVGKFFGIGDDKPVDKIKPVTVPTIDITKGRDPESSTKKQAESVAAAWKEIRDTTRRGAAYVEEQYRDMRVNTTRTMNRLFRDHRGIWGDIERSGKRHATDMYLGVKGSIGALQETVYDGMKYVAETTNKALRGLDATPVKISLSRPDGGGNDKVQRSATGGVMGWVGNAGERGKDKVMALLGRGELVLNHWQQKALNYMLPVGHTVQSALSQIGYHAGGKEQPGYAAGGSVQRGLQPHVQAIAQMINRRWGPLTIGGYRPADAYGEHSTGRAIDVMTGNARQSKAASRKGDEIVDWLLDQAARLGLKWAIWKQRINSGGGWRAMENRGNDTQNHWDHVHAFFAEAGKRGGVSFKNLGLPTDDTRIKSPRVTGSAGPLRTLAEKAIKSVVSAANKKIDSSQETLNVGQIPIDVDAQKGGKDSLSRNQVISIFKKAFGLALPYKGVKESQPHWLSNLVNLAYEESTWRPNAENRTPAGIAAGLPQGILQVVKSTFASFAKPGFNNPFNPLHSAIASIRYQIDRYGDIKRHAPYARGGIIPGQDGRGVPILAHAGEWILNKFQQSRLGQMMGMNPQAIASMLGFYGGGGKKGFAGGTSNPLLREDDYLANIGTSEQQKKRLQQIAKGFYNLPAFALDDWSDLLKEVQRSFRAISQGAKKIKDKTKRAGARVDAIEALIKDGGIFDQMEDARDRFGATLARRLALMSFKFNKANRTVVQAGTPLSRAMDELTIAQAEIGRIIGERGAIQKALNKVSAELKRVMRGGVSKSETSNVRLLNNQRTRLQERLDNINDAYTQQLESIFNAQEAVAQATIDQINTQADRASSNADVVRRIGAAVGNDLMVNVANATSRNIMSIQADELEKQIGAASARGNNDLAAQLAQQVTDLRLQIFESLQQELRDSVDAINKHAQRQLSGLDLANRLFDALGTVGINTASAAIGGGASRSTIFKARNDVLVNQQSAIQGKLQEAAGLGNIAVVEELTDQLAELHVAIAENTQAYFSARFDDVNARTNFATQVNDLNKQIIELQGGISGSLDNAALLSLAQQRTVILENQRAELQALLNEARSAGNQQNINTLTVAMLENKVALLQNTQAINELNGNMTEPQSFTSSAWNLFRQAIFNGNGGLLPQYSVPLGITPSQIAINSSTTSTMTNVGAGVASAPNTQYNDIDVNLSHPVEDVSGIEIGSRVAWAIKTANTET
jgi:hypothetical protein